MDKCPLCNSDTEYFKQGLRCKNTRYITIFELYVRQKKDKYWYFHMPKDGSCGYFKIFIGDQKND